MKQTAWHRSATAAVVLAAGTGLSAHAASRTVDTHAEGWSAFGDIAGPLTWSGSGGNAAGNVSIVDSATGGANQFDASDVVLIGGGLTLAFDLPTNRANGSWTSYAVPLDASAWHLGTLAGAVPTSAQFQSAPSSLTALRIRAEYQTGADTDSLDNVHLAGAVPEPQTYLLMLVGLGALAVARRRQRAG